MIASRAKETRNAEVNQFDVAGARQHDVAWFHIAENNRRVLAVQILQHITELASPAEHPPFSERSLVAIEQIFQRRTINIFHYHEIALILGEEAGEGGEIGVIEAPENLGLDLKILDGLGLLIGRDHRETHLFDSTDGTMAFDILRHVHGSHAPLPNDALDHIALMQQGTAVKLSCLCVWAAALTDDDPSQFLLGSEKLTAFSIAYLCSTNYLLMYHLVSFSHYTNVFGEFYINMRTNIAVFDYLLYFSCAQRFSGAATAH